MQETVDDDLKRYEGQLEVSQGQSETNRYACTHNMYHTYHGFHDP